MCLSLPSAFAFAFVGSFLCRAIVGGSLALLGFMFACVFHAGSAPVCPGMSAYALLAVWVSSSRLTCWHLPPCAVLAFNTCISQRFCLPARIPPLTSASLGASGCGMVRGRLCVRWGWQRFKLNSVTALVEMETPLFPSVSLTGTGTGEEKLLPWWLQ